MMRFLTSNLKWIMYALMIFDHACAIWMPEYWFLRIPAKVVYPYFIWQGVIAIRESSDLTKYFAGLAILAVISQFPFSLVFENIVFNDMFGILIGLLTIWMYRETESLLVVFAAFIGCFLGNIITGVSGIVLAFLINEVYSYLPRLKRQRLAFSKYWLYSIYPLHFLVLGGLRYANL